MNTSRIPVAILGATGAVGQAFIRQLSNHPWFRIAEVAASHRSAGKKYSEAAKWLEGKLPDDVSSLVVKECDPEKVESPLVFSALDSDVSLQLEADFARSGRLVLSNAKSYRMESDVPLVIPEVNGHHLDILTTQQSKRGWAGAIVTNANCAATVIATALAPLHEEFGLNKLFVTTMQAISGAGYPGVPSLDILGNVIPYIGEEEEKIDREVPKLLGTLGNGLLKSADILISSHANRVAVEHGHTVCISAGFNKALEPNEAMRLMLEWKGNPHVAGLPSAPDIPVHVFDSIDRPQPRRDLMNGRGMTVSVGRVRRDTMLDIRFVAMGHNILRGAAGGSVLNAELLVKKGVIEMPAGLLRVSP